MALLRERAGAGIDHPLAAQQATHRSVGTTVVRLLHPPASGPSACIPFAANCMFSTVSLTADNKLCNGKCIPADTCCTKPDSCPTSNPCLRDGGSCSAPDVPQTPTTTIEKTEDGKCWMLVLSYLVS